MKRIVSLICAIWIIVSASGQPKDLCISTTKTTSLVFPFPIVHVDRGTKDILVQLVPNAENLLLVKAGSKDFLPTNLTVYTKDGNLYAFSLCYEESPLAVSYRISSAKKTSVERLAGNLLDNPPTLTGINSHAGDITSRVDGIYVRDNVVFVKIRLENKSPFSYDIDLIRAYITDKRQSKKTAVQSVEIPSIFTTENSEHVDAFSTGVMILAYNKFTLTNKKEFVIQFVEGNGSRHLSLRINNTKMAQGISLPTTSPKH